MDAPSEINADLARINNNQIAVVIHDDTSDSIETFSAQYELEKINNSPVKVLNDAIEMTDSTLINNNQIAVVIHDDTSDSIETFTAQYELEKIKNSPVKVLNDAIEMTDSTLMNNNQIAVVIHDDTSDSIETFTAQHELERINNSPLKVLNDAIEMTDSSDISIPEVINTNQNELSSFNDNLESEGTVDLTDDNLDQSNTFVEYDFKQIPYQITGSWKEFSSKSRNNFTRGCKWAPDGSCILTCSDDNNLKIFNLPSQLWDSTQWHEISEMDAVVKITEGELIYDYCWYPLMNSSDPSTCCLVSASKNSTVHLWDGFTGELRCSYRAYNQMDEIVTPHSLGFNVDGQKLFCGFENVVRVFNVDTPGRNFEERYVFAKKSGQSGIISCFAFTPADENISAIGSYQKTIGIYSEPSGSLECLLEGQKGGITQLQFSPDGVCLYSGGRKDPEILCWDLRNLGTVLFSLRRCSTTNQRMYFDISRCGKYVVSGNQNGVITIWDVTKEPKIISEEEFTILEPIQYYMAHDDCVNGISWHPTFPLLCSSSGQRKFPSLLSDDDDGIFSSKIDKFDNSLRLWWLGKM